MDPNDAGALAILMLFAGIFGLVLAVLWALVPFAVFGLKPKLDVLIGEQRRTNALLEQLLHETQSQRK